MNNVLRKGHILVILVIATSATLFSTFPNSFAASSASVSIPAGTSVPGCEVGYGCYIPSQVKIEVGGQVTWSNDDSAAHTVTSGTPDDIESVGALFDSSLFMAGTTFTITANSPGTYPYFCMVHPWMTGSIVVLDSGYSIPKTPTSSSTKSSPINRDDKTYYVYIDKMPENWKSQFGHLYNDATAYWENKIPGLKFYVTTQREKADFVVQWASQFVENKLGYWTTYTDNSYGKPYMAVTLGFMDDDSVAWQERKFNRVDSEYALDITKHELGHVIGFGHSEDLNDIMYGTFPDYGRWLKARDEGRLPSSDSSGITFYQRAQILQEKTNSEIDKLKSGIETAENSLSGLEYESPDAQKKIEQAWKIRWSALEKLDQAKVKWDIGVNEIDKQNFRTAIINFKGIETDSESIGNNLKWITSIIEDTEKLENKYQSLKKTESKVQKGSESQEKEEKDKFCFLFWCW